MPFRQTIAAKIFGLAIILLLLTIGLACFLLFEVTRTTQDLTVVANFDVPLTQSVARLHEFGLRRRLAFERWFGALNAAEPNPEIVAEATENYALFTRKLTEEFFRCAAHHWRLSEECTGQSDAGRGSDTPGSNRTCLSDYQ